MQPVWVKQLQRVSRVSVYLNIILEPFSSPMTTELRKLSITIQLVRVIRDHWLFWHSRLSDCGEPLIDQRRADHLHNLSSHHTKCDWLLCVFKFVFFLKGLSRMGSESPVTWIDSYHIRCAPPPTCIRVSMWFDVGRGLGFADLRASKVSHIQANPSVEIAWYLRENKEQFRIRGKSHIISASSTDPESQAIYK